MYNIIKLMFCLQRFVNAQCTLNIWYTFYNVNLCNFKSSLSPSFIFQSFPKARSHSKSFDHINIFAKRLLESRSPHDSVWCCTGRFWLHWRYKCPLWEEECAKIVNKCNNFSSWEYCSSKYKRWSGHFLCPFYLVSWRQHWPFWGFQASLPGRVWESLDPSFSCAHHTWEHRTQINYKTKHPHLLYL